MTSHTGTKAYIKKQGFPAEVLADVRLDWVVHWQPGFSLIREIEATYFADTPANQTGLTFGHLLALGVEDLEDIIGFNVGQLSILRRIMGALHISWHAFPLVEDGWSKEDQNLLHTRLAELLAFVEQARVVTDQQVQIPVREVWAMAWDGNGQIVIEPDGLPRLIQTGQQNGRLHWWGQELIRLLEPQADHLVPDATCNGSGQAKLVPTSTPINLFVKSPGALELLPQLGITSMEQLQQHAWAIIAERSFGGQRIHNVMAKALNVSLHRFEDHHELTSPVPDSTPVISTPCDQYLSWAFAKKLRLNYQITDMETLAISLDRFATATGKTRHAVLSAVQRFANDQAQTSTSPPAPLVH